MRPSPHRIFTLSGQEPSLHSVEAQREVWVHLYVREIFVWLLLEAINLALPISLPLGEQNIVVLNDWDSVKDSLRKDSFLGMRKCTSTPLMTLILDRAT